MGMTKRVERSAKRLLVRLIVGMVKTEKLGVDEIFAMPPGRVLVVRQHNQMGDMLLSVPAFRAIKQTFERVELGVVTSQINRDVLLGQPFVDDVYTYRRSPLRFLSIVRAVRRRKYDLVIVLHTVSFSFTSALLGLISGARVRIGSTSRPFGNSIADSFFHMELPLPSAEELRHMNEAEHNLFPLRAVGIDTHDLSPVFVPTAASDAWAERFLGEHSKPGTLNIVVHPGAGKRDNIWPPDKFAGVLGEIARTRPVSLCIVEGPRDTRHTHALCGQTATHRFLLRGRPIGDVAAVLKRADLVLCNDTGVMHVSAAVGARTVAVFGPTDPVRWAPRCPNLRVVKAKDGDLSRLTVAEVMSEVESMLNLVHGAQSNV
jgi:ADP-heptose:LPS heptosyltransferase